MDTLTLVQQLNSELEAKFKKKGLYEHLENLVSRALDVDDVELLGVLKALKSPLIMLRSEEEKHEKILTDWQKVDFSHREKYRDGVPMGFWRRILEIEAIHRDLVDVKHEKILEAISNETSSPATITPEEAPPEEIPPKEASTAKNAPQRLRKQVVALRNKGLSFAQIEKKLRLRQARGMTAHRIYNSEVAKPKKARKKNRR